MDYTPNYNLKKPGQDDFYNIEDFNENADIIDQKLKEIEDKTNNIEVPVTSINGKTGDVQLVAEDVGAETPEGAQAKANIALDTANQYTDQVAGVLSTQMAELEQNKVNAFYTGATNIDPDTTDLPYIITSHVNCPTNAGYHILTFFREENGNRMQIAIKYSGNDEMYIRRYHNNAYSTWKRIWHEGNFSPSNYVTSSSRNMNKTELTGTVPKNGGKVIKTIPIGSGKIGGNVIICRTDNLVSGISVDIHGIIKVGRDTALCYLPNNNNNGHSLKRKVPILESVSSSNILSHLHILGSYKSGGSNNYWNLGLNDIWIEGTNICLEIVNNNPSADMDISATIFWEVW